MNDYYDRARKFGIYWKHHAEMFYVSANALWRSPEINNSQSRFKIRMVFEYLCGTALELYLKSCWVKVSTQEEVIKLFNSTGKTRITIEDEKINSIVDSNKFFTHKLDVIAKKIELKITTEEEKILKKLTEIILWASKYPIPRKLDDYENYLNFMDSLMIIKSSHGDLAFKTANPTYHIDWNNFKKIWDKVEVFHNDLPII